ncbi:MAG: pyridoxamine 5'-phosphate oxidase family protein [Novosphingobium sp.]|jgi:nitroimidazol reductase NimA-like FMN-containing flavoprotein (pyridoxamine 5'-phosphate oxidase superfamily)|nr:pyridoxamine 5'-phosphate oxidase family protein [Novosphingobium sp.]
MPSRRDLIRMTSGEVMAYLTSQRRIILVTNGPDGMPHPVPMNYGLDGEGRILITSFRKSQKVKNLERDSRATLLVESGETYANLKSVMVYADAEIVTDPAAIAAGMARINADERLAGSPNAGMGTRSAPRWPSACCCASRLSARSVGTTASSAISIECLCGKNGGNRRRAIFLLFAAAHTRWVASNRRAGLVPPQSGAA